MIDTELQLEAEISLRKATPDDIPVMLELIQALAAYQRQDERVTITTQDLRRDGFGPNPQFECILAETNEKAVGLAIFHPTYSTWDGMRGIYVDDLFVSEVVRGQGVGHKLMKEVARIGQERGCGYLALNVVHANPARNSYDRFGFVHVDDLLTYRLKGERFTALVES